MFNRIRLFCVSLLFIATSLVGSTTPPMMVYESATSFRFENVEPARKVDFSMIKAEDESPAIDDKYIAIEFDEFVKAIRAFHSLHGVEPYKKQSRDCDDFAFKFYSWARFDRAFDYAKSEAAIGVFVIFVEHRDAFGNITGSNQNHALNLVLTTRGWMVFEPQSLTYTPFELYPNRNNVYFLVK